MIAPSSHCCKQEGYIARLAIPRHIDRKRILEEEGVGLIKSVGKQTDIKTVLTVPMLLHSIGISPVYLASCVVEATPKNAWDM